MRFKKKSFRNKQNNIIISHIQNNIREYTIACLIFLMGILFGILFVNNLDETQRYEINTYVSNSINSIKEGSNGLNKLLLFKDSAKEDLIFVISLWLLGSTIIGLLLVYVIVFFKGFIFRI